MKFKTNARCGGCSAIIIESLGKLAPAEDWSLDLQSADKVLSYHGKAPVSAADVIEAVSGCGFNITLLEE